MLQEVDFQIFCIKLPMPFSTHLLPFSESRVNVYLVRRGQSLLLVDCGVNDAGSYAVLRDSFARLGLKLSQLTHIVVTHGHPDHAGLLDMLMDEAPGAQVYLHQRELRLVEERYFRPGQSLKKFQDWFARLDLFPESYPVYADIKLDYGRFTGRTELGFGSDSLTIELDGEEWHLVCTPGHSPGHLVIYQPDRQLLLTGDHLFAGFTPNVSRFPGSSPDPLADYLASLGLVSRLAVKTALPGHGPAFTGIAAQVARSLKQHQRKLNRIMEVITGEPVSPYRIVQQLGQRGLAVDSQRAALTETDAYLTWLSRHNYLESEIKDGIVRYFCPASRPSAGPVTLSLAGYEVPFSVEENKTTAGEPNAAVGTGSWNVRERPAPGYQNPQHNGVIKCLQP